MEEPRRLGGRYELSHVLGRGGMAEVYLAHDTRLGRTVAVKTLRADLARDPSFQARFRREAQSAASLNHPAIVAVYDTGEDYVDNISIPYIVMEYVDGSTLRELLHSGRKLLPERTLEMCIGILQALEYSHRAGIVHRDIKPANVMLTRTGQVKVMDFGIARAMGDSGMTMTQTAAVIGTAQYLSPEQAKGEQVDARSDLYSMRLPALRAPQRAAPVRRRLPRGRRLPARTGRAAAAVELRPRDHARDGRHRPEGAGQGSRLPLPVRRRDARRHRGLPRRPARRRRFHGHVRLRLPRPGRLRTPGLRPAHRRPARRRLRPDLDDAAHAPG